MPDKRPNPEKLLLRVQEEERKQLRGKLKIYLGAAPGVGKTHEMLHDALEERKKGLDVVVGVAESHGRQEIKSMIAEFEILAPQVIDYHGKQLLEFDLDAALNRHPGLILIDEMAHTNSPGLRHAKRWQDIKELLDRGVNVYTTLNVQHIESLNNNVSQIIHAPIKETVPDSMIDIANTIELVDIAPEDLLKRLREGKIYIPKQAELASENFFREGNLTALRELALRATAEHVGDQVLLYRQGQGITAVWPTNDKILVCVGPGAESLKLIRSARRMSASLQAKWIAVYVDRPRLQASETDRNNAIQNLRLAEQLGAETRVLSGFDIVKEIMSFAREENVTRIMIWKYIRTRWKDFFVRNLADEVVRNSGEIDVYIMTGKADDTKPRNNAPIVKSKIPWSIYGISIGIVALITLLNILLYPFLAASNLVMLYLLGVTIIALFGQRGPSILASIMSVLAYDVFFLPSFHHFSVLDIEYIITLIVMLVVSNVISHLTILIRRQSETARLNESQTSALYKLSRQLASTRGVDKLLKIGVQYIAENFNCKVTALLPEKGHLKVRARHGTKEIVGTKEQSIAQWVYDLGQAAGLGTDTLSFSEAFYIPLLGSHGPLGVLQIYPIQFKSLFSPEQMRSLEACANQIALSIEVDRTSKKIQKPDLESEAKKIQEALLEAISHDLRTPLASIMATASTQIELAHELNATRIKKLGEQIYFEGERLSRLINNFLQITYLESKSVKLAKELVSLHELANAVMKTTNIKLENRNIKIYIPENLPKVPIDNILIQEVLINLIDNASKFTPPDTPIEIYANLDNDKIIVSVEDYGPGIVEDEVNKLFDKFYRGRKLITDRGLGLGLAICKKIIEAHGGKIWAENRKEGGAAFRFTLPLT